ncbi:MAG: hypothetical protein OEO84_11510 [Betaproteobacteria bacterium]|nr:hypothetical protein [Betaproteobacteria bacterium]
MMMLMMFLSAGSIGGAITGSRIGKNLLTLGRMSPHKMALLPLPSLGAMAHKGALMSCREPLLPKKPAVV